ncbi:MAG: rRNA pseudouridine synthase [Eubacterium sp.]|nr:rRNA pseudouridine synthase [Eubacterium sp.]
MRLDKFLCDMQLGSRSEIKKAAAKGKITVNQEICKDTSRKIVPGEDEVCFDGSLITYEEYQYYLFYKPYGCITATSDPVQSTVMDIFKGTKGKGLFPVGRLDKDTEGLLIITNDGEFGHQLLSPAKHVEKTYYAIVSGSVTEEDVNLFKKGVNIGKGVLTRPAKLHVLAAYDSETMVQRRAAQKIPDYFCPRFLPEHPYSEIEATITEGKFHQVKRMFSAVDKEVLYLKRLSMGEFVLDDSLSPGEFRPFSEAELQLVKQYGTGK